MKKLTFLFLVLGFLFSCNKNDEKDPSPQPPQTPEAPQPSLPVLTTKTVSKILATSAESGGNITSDGEASISHRGIVWNTSPNPTIELETKTSNGNGAGDFTSHMTDLVENTTYYVRAYATNTAGTAYGNELSFKAVSPFAALETAIENKMDQYGMPGASIAIVRNGKLVYLNSFGYADIEGNELATNESLWRIASNSKPITVVAILKLVQDGLLSLDQKVFGDDGILGNDYGEVPPGSNKDLITVRHLMEHESGWTNTPYDPMFSPVGVTQSQIIQGVLANWDLTHYPGEAYYYLNFGYCILGRVIEKVSHMTYENYVKSDILSPMGITEMKIGGNTLAERFNNEVKYYQNEYSPYIMNITRMDSHGGWIASAKDMARFIVRIDRQTSVPDILPLNTLLQNSYFGYINWVHFGSIPGTSAILNRLNDTYSFVLMTNTRTSADGNIILEDLNNTMTTQIQAISEWPDEDLF